MWTLQANPDLSGDLVIHASVNEPGQLAGPVRSAILSIPAHELSSISKPFFDRATVVSCSPVGRYLERRIKEVEEKYLKASTDTSVDIAKLPACELTT